MSDPKIHIYFIPGLAASPKIFEFLKLPEDRFELHYLEWILPESADESIESYAKRMCESIHTENPVLVGVSFGGIIVQEMSLYLNPLKVIIISSVKSKNELPKRLQLLKTSKLYKLFPTKVISNIEEFTVYAFGDFAKKRVELYKQYLSVRNEKYLEWALYNVLHWKRENPLPYILHIHGEDDQMFPIKHIENCLRIPKGNHVMILTKAKRISAIICDAL